MQGQIQNKINQVNFQPSFHRKQLESPKSATYRTKSTEILLSFEEKCLMLERKLHKQQNMTRKHSNQRSDFSLPVFNNDIISRDIPHFSNKFERNYQSPFIIVEVRDVRPGVPLKLDLGDHVTSPKKRIGSYLKGSPTQKGTWKERRGVKVKFIGGLNQTIIQQDPRHEQSQLDLKQTNQNFPLPLINSASKIELGKKRKQRPRNNQNKNRVSLSLPSIKNRLQRSEQEKISLVCQNCDKTVKQNKEPVDDESQRYEMIGNRHRQNEKKILVKKIPKKKRMQVVGHKRMQTEPRVEEVDMQVVSERKKLSLKYEEKIRKHQHKIERVYYDNDSTNGKHNKIE